MRNLALPGNPKYQPKDLQPIFGKDNLVLPIIEVELAAMEVLAELGVIPAKDFALLTPDIKVRLSEITTTQMEEVERNITSHDIRALVRLMQEILPVPLRRWVHVPLTSYDALDTSRVLLFKRAHEKVVRPKMKRTISILRDRARRTADMTQVGRTHGQHALPITVGFWLASLLGRMLANAQKMDAFAGELRGKISGAVGAYNAQVGLGFYRGKDGRTFEERVLEKLGLKPAPISTQILLPEPLSYYLFSCTLMSASLGQLGLDCRQLMRTEIGEIREPFEKGQVGSSTMAHKRNPINFENIQGMWDGARSEFGKVLSLLLSEHQRDLVGSSVARDLPTIIVKLVTQFDTMLRPSKTDPRPFVERIEFDRDACLRNLGMQGDALLAEPMYIALQIGGYEGDAHALVNEWAMDIRRSKSTTLLEAIRQISENDAEVKSALDNIPEETMRLFASPALYIGGSVEKTEELCEAADAYLR